MDKRKREWKGKIRSRKNRRKENREEEAGKEKERLR